MKSSGCVSFICAGAAFLHSQISLGNSAYIAESARAIPVCQEADVVIVGGSCGAVAAAQAAALAGAKVFLAAPRPYLGDDVAGTLRLLADWLDE